MRRLAAFSCALLATSLLAACGSGSSSAGNDDNGGNPGGGPTGPRAGTWLAGDLHLHSDHSTDAADNPEAEIIKVAEDRGMGFFVVTDHDNHVEGHITTWDDPAYHSDKMIMLYGVEYTTARGHANLIGTQRFDDMPMYALRDRTDAAAGQAIYDTAHAQGLHVSVNHPVNGDPWEFGFDMDIDSMEVWNALFAYPTDNDGAIALWDSLLKSGRRITARGGSDCHHQTGIEAQGLNVGNPTNWVYAEAPTGAAVLAALKAGHVSVGYDPRAERIELSADGDGDGSYETMMGDNLPADGKTIHFKIDIANARALGRYEVSVIKNGETEPFLKRSLFGESGMSFDDTPTAGQRSYYRVEVRGTTPQAPLAAVLLGFYGGFVGLTNPVYVGY
jgi:hypothetical protein